jgi:predicted HTH transcriptional regulator
MVSQVARSERGFALPENTSPVDTLTHLNLMDGGQPSAGALLLFGKNPQRFILPSEVKCLHFHGKVVEKPIPSYQIFKGTLFDLSDQAVDFVLAKVDRRVIPSENQVAGEVEYEIPLKVIREAIVNAVPHRNYVSNASVQVMIFLTGLRSGIRVSSSGYDNSKAC